ncbi:hypothetical protein F4X90_00865, partial [Candidatus Poribacteria bacterium]|nr:hypothetical protein [Candidatus Poribacteria bacterium]
MQELLKQNNIALRHEIEQLQGSLIEASENLPEELHAYTEWIAKECKFHHQRVLDNLEYLEFGQENLLKDILSETELITRAFYRLNGNQVSPILRARASDRLSLEFLLWLHATHPQMKSVPAAICDGEFSVWPIQPTLYATPCTSQQGLRNLPIFFHEFGHLLYTFHQPEMDALVNELQGKIRALLHSSMDRNDEYERTRATERDIIVHTWYEWAQECFCDAVGFVMGGPSFAYVFSTYFRILGKSGYHLPREDLARSSHPVAWIRIHLLADRARQVGYKEVAADLEEKWSQVAAALGVVEDYYGFYDPKDPKFLSVIQSKLDDMLTETSPREFQDSEVSNQEESTFTSPVALLNAAWQKFQDDPENYREWEEDAIARFLDA